MDDLHEKERTPCVNFYFGMRFFRKRAQIYDNAGGDRPHDPRNSETLTCRRAYAASNKIRPGEDVREKSGCKGHGGWRSKDTAVLLPQERCGFQGILREMLHRRKQTEEICRSKQK